VNAAMATASQAASPYGQNGWVVRRLARFRCGLAGSLDLGGLFSTARFTVLWVVPHITAAPRYEPTSR